MVTRSLCLFLLVGSLIQVNDATPSVVIIAQYIPKFLSLSVRVAKTVASGTQQILNTQNNIKQLVDSAEHNTTKQLTDLDEFIATAKHDASKSGTDITSCLIEEQQAINSTHLNILEKCRLEDGVKHLHEFSLKLAKAELSLSIAVQWCIVKNPVNGTTLQTCFDEKIDIMESKIAEFQKEIDTTLPEAMEYSQSCTARYLESLNIAIDKIYQTFKSCTETVTPDYLLQIINNGNVN